MMTCWWWWYVMLLRIFIWRLVMTCLLLLWCLLIDFCLFSSFLFLFDFLTSHLNHIRTFFALDVQTSFSVSVLDTKRGNLGWNALLRVVLVHLWFTSILTIYSFVIYSHPTDHTFIYTIWHMQTNLTLSLLLFVYNKPYLSAYMHSYLHVQYADIDIHYIYGWFIHSKYHFMFRWRH